MNKKEKNIIEEYEKYGKKYITIDDWTTRIMNIAIILFIALLIITLFYYVFPESTVKTVFENALINSYLIILSIMALAYLLLFAKFFLMRKKFDNFHIIKIYFHILSKNPETKKRDEILKHIFHTLIIIKKEFTKRIDIIFKTPMIKRYVDLKNHENKFKEETINDVILFLIKTIPYLSEKDVSKKYIEIGNYFKDHKFARIIKLIHDMSNSKVIINDFDNKILGKSVQGKLSSFSRWFSNNNAILGIFITTLITIILRILNIL